MPRQLFQLVKKTEIVPQIFLCIFQTQVLDQFTPGQFFTFQIEPNANRAYSVGGIFQKLPVSFDPAESLADLTDSNQTYICFLISVKPGGIASQFFKEAKPGTQLTAIGPAGRFNLSSQTTKDKVFIATGTGLAPVLPMIEQLQSQDQKPEISVVFGVWQKSDDFSGRFLSGDTVSRYVVVDQPGENNPLVGDYYGKVTDMVPRYFSDLHAKEFYICGHPAMVVNMEKVLLEHGVVSHSIIIEKFGVLKK